MCGVGHYMEDKKGAHIQYPDLAKLICGQQVTDTGPVCPEGWDGAKYFWDRVSTNFALTQKNAIVHIFKPYVTSTKMVVTYARACVRVCVCVCVCVLVLCCVCTPFTVSVLYK